MQVMFRHTIAHAPKIQWEMSEQDALETMTIASLCHRKPDRALQNPVKQN